MAQLCPTDEEIEHVARQAFLDEECTKVHVGDEWELVDVPYFLENSTSNHMTGNKDVFADHDIKIVPTGYASALTQSSTFVSVAPW
jgi:hypothetical protein